SPAGTPLIQASTTPPRESPSSLAVSIALIISSSMVGSSVLTGDTSDCFCFSSIVNDTSLALTSPISLTLPHTTISRFLNTTLATATASTRYVISHAEESSSTLRISLSPYFKAPFNSACPGLVLVTTLLSFVSSGNRASPIISDQRL